MPRVSIKKSNTKAYYVISADKTTFIVKVRGLLVRVYHVEYKWGKNPTGRTLVKRFFASKIFVGCSPRCSITRNNGRYGKEFDGNTILLRLLDDSYVLIATNSIISFRSLSPINNLISPIDYSGNTLPYATDVDKNIYLLYRCIIIKRTDLTDRYLKEKKLPYDIINMDDTRLDHIIFYKGGKMLRTAIFDPIPNRTYDKWLQFPPDNIPWLHDIVRIRYHLDRYPYRPEGIYMYDIIDKTRYELDRETYVSSIKQLGNTLGISCLPGIKVEFESDN